MNLTRKIIDWIKYKKEHEYEEPIPLLIYIGGAFNRISLVINFILIISLIPIFIYKPFSLNTNTFQSLLFNTIYGIGFLLCITGIILKSIEPFIHQWIASWPKHHAKHFMAFFLSLVIIKIPIAWYYFYRKENVVRYFNQFKS